MTIPQKVYLDIVVATNYPEQEPEHKAARWIHMLWFLVPIVGVIGFLESVKDSYHKNKPKVEQNAKRKQS